MVPDAVIAQLRADIIETVRRELKLICPGDGEMYPAISCKEIYECNSTTPSGYYWVNTTTGVQQIFCSAGVQCVNLCIQCQAFPHMCLENHCIFVIVIRQVPLASHVCTSSSCGLVHSPLHLCSRP